MMVLGGISVTIRKDVLTLTIGLLGGDRRMEIAADFLRNAGHTVAFPTGGAPTEAFFSALDLLVLPYPATRDGKHIALTTLPFSSLPLSKKTALFGGRLPPAWREGRPSGEAEENEEYLCGNAYLTAAAGVATALRAGERAFFRVRAAVLGYGRIGKETAKMLRALGAEVTVYVRREAAKEEAARDGFAARLLQDTRRLSEGLVFGTVPAPAENLASLTVKEDALIYDLGGGLPEAMATEGEMPVRTLPLRGAPGVFAPKAAGELYAGAILDFIAKTLDPERKHDP